jgi:SMODS and SLOG-associating 2TM effector domain 2
VVETWVQPKTVSQMGTLYPIELNIEGYKDKSYGELISLLFADARDLKLARFQWYENLRARLSSWANLSRQALACLGALAIALTAIASVLRFWEQPTAPGLPAPDWDLYLLIVALALYGTMGAVSFFVKETGETSSYLRSLVVLQAIRDRWTKFEFDYLRFVVATRPGDAAGEQAAADRLLELVAAFCADLDKIATGELTEWRTEFLASLSDMDAAARKGTDDTQKLLQDMSKTMDELRKKTAEAAAAAAAAAEPAKVNLTIKGEFEGQAVVSVDGHEMCRASLASIALPPLSPGIRIFQIRAAKDAKGLEASDYKELKPGLQNVELTLSPVTSG